MDGLISVERFSSLNEDGKLLSLSVWENEAVAERWRNQLVQRESQKVGHDSLFENTILPWPRLSGNILIKIEYKRRRIQMII